ncbi:RagB/SusD family nutrient uptake outer membrane protein [Mariniphaga anaerophila]|nr:RagB/SusD family nutrient uptake outer membrane protein [Mariniphaga anaerophila]
MKKIVFFLSILLIVTSCSDLEVEPGDRYSNGVVWENEKALDMYVKGFYAALRDNAEIHSLQMSDGLSDILKYSVNNIDGNTFQNKVLLQENYITPNNGALSEWGNYDRIKLQNEFLHDVETMAGDFDPDFIAVRKAEVRFMRAFLYYQLIRNHGGIILRTENSGADGGLDNAKDANKARISEKESWDFVINELKDVAETLAPHKWSSENFGRITAGAAYALLTRCALYAERYDDVIWAGKKVEDLGYSLESQYANIFKNKASSEIILPVLFKKPDYVHYFDRYFGPTGDFANRGGWACPTEELVKHYQIEVDGKYENFDWNNPEHSQNPYANREPRFYASVLYNGANWNGRKIETFVGGADGFMEYDFSSNNTGCVTGYFMKKYMEEGNEDVDKGSDTYWVELRFAEVLLNLAEAHAQSGDIAKGYEYLNRVRTRGGYLAPRQSNSSLDIFMSDLETERMLELAFEGHRYWDIRRWKRAEEIINGKRAHGVKITKNEEGNWDYQVTEIESDDRYFPEKYYKIPIPQLEIRNNSLCEQTFPW